LLFSNISGPKAPSISSKLSPSSASPSRASPSLLAPPASSPPY
jgi:hypothetical protein